jgi:hypothetical protein
MRLSPEFSAIAFVDMDTGEFQERRLEHPEEAEKFYPPGEIQRETSRVLVLNLS